MNSPHVAWLHRSRIYHSLTRATAKPDNTLTAPCGVVLHKPGRYRSMDGTAHDARKVGLRACRRCFKKEKR